MPSWTYFQPFVVSGLALGGVYALSGVGLVVLYRATGVVYLAFGAVGAMGALIAWSLIKDTGVPGWVGWLVCVLFAGAVTLAYGMVFGPALAKRDPLIKAVATLGLTLVLFGVMDLLWTSGGGQSRAIALPTDNGGFVVGQLQVNWTQVIGLGAGIAITVVTGAFLRYTKLGTAMRAMANDRDITATLGVPVRRVEAAAWLGCGVLGGVAGLLLADLVALDAMTLTFLVISSLAAALIARLRSIALTFVAAIVIGLIHDLVTPIQALSNYRDMTPFVLAAVALLVAARRQLLSRCRWEARCRRGASCRSGGPVLDTASRSAGARQRAPLRRPAGRTLANACASAVLLLVALVALPDLLSIYYIDAMTQVAVYSMVALGLGLLVGRVGLVSLGQVAVLAIGAWVAARLLFATAQPYPAVLLEAGVITMAVGTLIGLPALRLRGLYL